MSNRSLTAVFQHSRSKGAARLILLAMADEANDQGLLTAYRRSRSYLSSKANVDEGTARRALAALEQAGEVIVLDRGDGRKSSDYQIVLPGLAPIEGVHPARNEGVHPAPPAPAERTPTPGNLHPQGDQDAPPIIPLLPSPSPSSPARAADRFQAFWAAYPTRDGKKVGRAVCEEIWVNLSDDDRAAAIVGAKNLARAVAAGGRFGVKDPERFIKKRCWLDWQQPAVIDPQPRPARHADHQRPTGLDAVAEYARQEGLLDDQG